MKSTIPGSSMVEQEAVNFEVAGSSPAPGAREIYVDPARGYFLSEVGLSKMGKMW